MANPYLEIAGESVQPQEPVTSDNPYLQIAGPDAPAGVAKPKVDQSYLAGLARTGIGQGAGLGFGDEIVAGLRTIFGENWEDAIKDERAKIEHFRKENPGTAFTAELAGGFLTPGVGLATGALKAANTTGQLLKQGAKVGAGFGAVHGFGSAEGGFTERLPGAAVGGAAGAALGTAIPAAIGGAGFVARKVGDAASPTLARWQQDLANLREDFGKKAMDWRKEHGILASADGGGLPMPPRPTGAEAAADQMLANQLMRAGKSVDDIRKVRADADDARRLNSNSYAQNAQSLMEADESLQRLAGSTVRASPEAGNRAKGFLEGRQTGITPVAGLPEGSGVPTRPLLAKPMTGAQAEKELGSRFGTPEDKIVPMGQGERVTDAFKRAMLLEDEVHHGHGANAYQTKKAMEKSLSEEANKLYPKAWAEAEEFDLSNAFAGLRAKGAEINDTRVERFFERLERLFSRKTGNGAPLSGADELRRFDLAKQRLDGLIDDFKGKDSFIYRSLVQFKHDLLDGVHGGDRLNPTKNKAYGEARDFYTTEKRSQEMIDLGRSVFKEGSDVGVDAFRMAETKADQKLFRLGLLGGAEEAVARMGRGHDATKIFDSKRIQDLLAEVIPRTETATGKVKKDAVFGDRPERFGKYIQNTKEETNTRQIVRGGSPTQRNKMDDDAYENMSRLTQAMNSLRSAPIVGASIQVIEHLAQKVFGMRADMANALARNLFTADAAKIEAILTRVEQRMGPERFAHFTKLISDYQASVAPAALSGGSSLYGSQ
jgi:hypothetical protein